MDEVTLTLPRDEAFVGVVHLVLGGLAVRLDLTVEKLEDLRLALDDLIAHELGGEDVTIEVRLHDGTMETTVGPFEPEVLRARLDGDLDGRLGLRRILETVVDGYAVGERGSTHWVELTTTVGGARG